MNVLEKILEEIEDLNYYPEGMGCGIEDCGITDRYEACEYGWNKAIEAVTEVIESMNDVTDINVGSSWIPCSERLPEKSINVKKLIETFEDMKNRGTLLTGSDVAQEDLFIQIVGTIVKTCIE